MPEFDEFEFPYYEDDDRGDEYYDQVYCGDPNCTYCNPGAIRHIPEQYDMPPRDEMLSDDFEDDYFDEGDDYFEGDYFCDDPNCAYCNRRRFS